MANSETERVAIEYVMALKCRAGRRPEDVHLHGFPYDVSSPPRKIEVKAFGAAARGAPIPLEDRQVKAARDDLEHFYVYVVDNIAGASRRVPEGHARSGHASHLLLADAPYRRLRADARGNPVIGVGTKCAWDAAGARETDEAQARVEACRYQEA